MTRSVNSMSLVKFSSELADNIDMRDSRSRFRSWRPLVLLVGLAAGGCAGTRHGDLRFVSASARQDGSHYSVLALIENVSPAAVSMDSVSIEMTTYDGEGKVIASGYPITVVAPAVEPGLRTRVPISCPDREHRVRGSKLFLKNARGRVISEMEVGPIASPDADGPAESPPGASEQPPLDLKLLGRPE
jgi:hypothetical protein